MFVVAEAERGGPGVVLEADPGAVFAWPAQYGNRLTSGDTTATEIDSRF